MKDLPAIYARPDFEPGGEAKRLGPSHGPARAQATPRSALLASDGNGRVRGESEGERDVQLLTARHGRGQS
jgi:hypothetical protein